MDGLVSNLALMTGVAGGAVSQQTIVITGLAGLAAGAFSMAAGSTPPSPRSANSSRPSSTSSGVSCASTRRTRCGSSPRSTSPRGRASPRPGGREAAVQGPRAGARDTRPRGARHRPGRPALTPRRRPVLLRRLRPGSPAARPALPARRDRPVARRAARAGGPLRLRRGGGPGDGAYLVVQRSASAGARRRRRGDHLRSGLTLRCGSRLIPGRASDVSRSGCVPPLGRGFPHGSRRCDRVMYVLVYVTGRMGCARRKMRRYAALHISSRYSAVSIP